MSSDKEYVKVPIDLFGKVDPLSIVVFAAILSFRNRKTGACFPSVPAILARAGIDHKSFYVKRRQLVNAGFLEFVSIPGRRGRTLYTFPFIEGKTGEKRVIKEAEKTGQKRVSKQGKNGSDIDLTAQKGEASENKEENAVIMRNKTGEISPDNHINQKKEPGNAPLPAPFNGAEVSLSEEPLLPEENARRARKLVEQLANRMNIGRAEA